MIYLHLFYEYFKVGLFAVGGGLATLPFLTDLGERTGWFSAGDLADMVAVSESTPGPLGVNMATYVGFHCGGALGGVTAVLGLIAPSIIIVLIVALFLKKFRQSRGVDAVFYGLRPASVGLVAAAFLQVCSIALLTTELEPGILEAVGFELFRWKAIVLGVAVFACLQLKPLKKVHPIVFIALSAVAGILFQI